MKEILTAIKYYKNTQAPNLVITGTGATPSIVDGVLSGITTTEYTVLPKNFNPAGRAWEMSVTFTMGDNISTTQYVYNQYNNINIVITSSGYLRVAFGTGSSWDILANTNLLAVSANTQYTIKIEFTGTSYITSVNGIVYNTCNSSVSIGTGVGNLGISNSKANPFLGSIDLKKSYIKIGGKIFWTGMVLEYATEDDYDYIQEASVYNVVKDTKTDYYTNSSTVNATIVGSPTNNNGVISNFSSSNYLQLGTPFNVSSFEWHIKFTMPTTIVSGKNQYLLAPLTNYKTPLILLTSNGNINFDLSSNGVNWDVVITVSSSDIELGATYTANLKWDGGLVTGYLKDALGNVINFHSISSYRDYATSITWTDDIKIGTNTSGSNPFDGSVDLKESYMIVNNKLWWTGMEVSSATQDSYDLAVNTKESPLPM